MQVSTLGFPISKAKLAPTLMPKSSGLCLPVTRMLLPVTGGTPTQRLASTLLGQPLEEWVARRRHAGMSWKTIADDLAASTNGQISVSRETLRGWFAPALSDVATW